MTLATITFQNYFRLYDKLAGMTGTAMTEAEEFHKIYELEVVAIPTHRDMIRDDEADLVFRNELGKFNALIDEVAEMNEAGRPVLVGTVSVEKSEILSTMLKRRGHQARDPEREVPREGIGDRRPGRADRRGHDRDEHGRPRHRHPARRQPGRARLGDPPQARPEPGRGRQGRPTTPRSPRRRLVTDEDHERVVGVGGLHIIGTERHDSRRIDNQLRGRAGRQGDPGSSRFYLSLEDDLMKRFASDRVAGLMERMGLEDDVAIESRLVSKTIESAQSPGRGLQLRHAQARRRVRRRDQPPARDDLRRARQGPPQRGPDRDRPDLPRRGDPTPSSPTTCPATRPTTGAWRRSPPPSRRWASTARARPRTSSGTSAAATRSSSTCSTSPTPG